MKTPMKQLSTILIIAFFAFSANLKAQTTIQGDIDAFIKTKMKELHIPALSYAVMYNGEYISSGVYGLAEVELNAPANEHTLFNVGSVGKTFTATAIMLLEEEGKLSIADPIGKHLEGIPDSWKNITIEHLLNHTSGIKDYTQDFPIYSLLPNIDRAVELTPEQYIEMCTSNPLNFPTGTNWAYSNSNYALLGFIIRKHIDSSMDEFMRKRIFEPAGMMDTRYEDAFELRPNRAKGYHVYENGIKNGALISNFYSTIGDCGILTTGNDLAKWAPALLSGKIISKTQLEKMWTKYQVNIGIEGIEDYKTYGLGWQIDDVMGSAEYGHDGSLKKGYTGFYRYYPKYDLSIAIMTNRWTGGPIFQFYEALSQRFIPDEIKFTTYIPLQGAAADNWIDKVKTFDKTLAENGDISALADDAYIKAIHRYKEIFGNGLNQNPYPDFPLEFLHEIDLSQKQVFKHGQRVKKIGLLSEKNAFMPENLQAFLSVYLNEADKILGVSYKVIQKE